MTIVSDGTSQWNGDLLGGDTPSSDATASQEEPPQRPLQLPRVGWGTDDDDDHDGDASSTNTPNSTEIPSMKNDDDADRGIVLRAMSRNSEGELAPIPEDLSMHGTFPDYYSDMFGCYDYDERKKYKYRRCGPKFKQRLLAVVLIVFAAIIGSKVSSKIGGKQKQQLPLNQQPGSTGGSSDSSSNAGDVSVQNSNDQYEYPDNPYPPGVDVYQVIVDTLDPMMFDDTTEEWDGTFFHAFEFCGATYSRVPCPYIAYCPMGPGKAPLGGTKIDVNDSWAPIFKHSRDPPVDQADWVQLGSEGTCELYSKQHNGEQPPWVNSAGGDEAKGITRHVMCCLESMDQVNGPSAEEVKDKWKVQSSDPDLINRPPSLEEDEVQKPIPIREEEGKEDGNEQKSGQDGN